MKQCWLEKNTSKALSHSRKGHFSLSSLHLFVKEVADDVFYVLHFSLLSVTGR